MEKFVRREIENSNAKDDIRFRVYNLKTGAFYPETEELFLSSVGDSLMTKDGRLLNLKENVIQQSTGERDMRGQLIYLGDILRTDEMGWKAAVVRYDGRFCLEDDHGGFSAEPHWCCCEIVGNIFSMKLHASLSLTEEEELSMDFWYACWNGDEEKVRELLPSCRKFLNRNLEFTECGVKKTLCLPLIAVLNSRYTDLDCLELLLKNGADPHRKCKNTGETPLSFAKGIGYLPIPEILKMMGGMARRPKGRLKHWIFRTR